jgi:hypothetical protein
MMGYYSEVAICMAFEDEQKRDAFWDLLVLRDDEVGYTIKQYCAKDDQNPWITYHDNEIKWYDSHPTRKSFEDTLCALVCECGGAWSMLRIGEDDNDVERDGCESKEGNVHEPMDAFYLSRRIEWN